MKLKKLEITGFKSFVDKTVIEFPAGISAIVGPNGCGKSNIVDALRWVMGEQSVKQLRGKSMDDVIFAGTNGKPPTNMAEVSLMLANDNGAGPEELKDFSEIMVTRRIYRSGESLYLLNKMPCRLKDIHNVFLGSGMGARTYSMIQQGNIGAITDAGPEERRIFIEEAAGITRYKARKKEALQKLDSTNQNIVRLNDIIAEVETQTNNLKRQAKKAERYKDLEARIRRIDILLSLRACDLVGKEIGHTNELLKSLKDTDIAHNSQMKKLDAAIEDIRLRRSQKNAEIAKQKSDKFEIQRKIDKIENDLAHLRQEADRLSIEAEQLKSMYESLEEKNKNISSEVEKAEKESADRISEIEGVKADLEKEREKGQLVRERVAALNAKLESAKTEFVDLSAREAGYRNICQNASNNKESLKRRLKRIAEEVLIAERKIGEAKEKSTHAFEYLESIRADLSAIENQVNEAKSNLQEKKTALAEQVKNTQSLEFERGKIKSKYSALKKMEDNYEWYRDGVKAVMKRNPENSRIIGLVADILEPDSDTGTATEAFLGEALQYIIVKEPKDAIEAIEYLKAESAGRCGFVPLSTIPQKVGEHGEQNLLAHITVKQGFEGIAATFLKDAVIVKNLETGLEEYKLIPYKLIPYEANRNSNAGNTVIVTNDGDIITPQGIIIGGSKDKLSGILAKKQELKDLETRIRDLESKLNTSKESQSALESQARQLEIDLQKLLEQKNETSLDETEAEKAFYRTQEELKHANRDLDLVKQEQERLMGEEEDVNQEIERSNTALAEISANVKSTQENMAKITEEIRIVSGEAEKFDRQIVDFKLRLTTLNAQLEHSKTALNRLKEFEKDSATRIEELSKDISGKADRKDNAEKKIKEYEAMLSKMYEEMRNIEKLLESNESDYQIIDDKLRQNDIQISEIQNKRNENLEKIRTLELELSRLMLKQENIVNRLSERYARPLSAFLEEFQEDIKKCDTSTQDMENELADYRDKLLKIGDVNLGAIKEYEEVKLRYDFLLKQREDLLKAASDLHRVINKINKMAEERFLETFNQVNEKLKEVFPKLFDGGSASLLLTEPEKPLETGVEFMVHPPGKKLTRMSLLSGGEKALSAIAFIFSIFLIRPAAFCIMDEIDAPLDDANVLRFNSLLRSIGENSQIVMITHKKKSMEFADTLFGVTMEKKGISRIVSVNFTA